MGKKAKFKKIRRLASTMPALNTKARVGSTVKGEQLISKGVKEVAGEDVKSDANYREVKTVMMPLNHNRKMKKLYNKAGASGVNAYIQTINRFVSSKKAAAAK